MTLIARLAINDFPMLVGDLLLSGPSVPDTQDDVPTTENLTAIFPAGSTYVPRGLRQKIAVVADNLVVGWAGRLITAQEVIAELRRKSASQPFTYVTLMKHFDSLSPSVWNGFGLVGFIDDTKDRVVQWGRSYWQVNTKLFRKVGLLGTGLDDVEKMLLSVPKLPEGLEHPLNGPEQALGFALHLTGSLLQLEIATGKSLSEFYGGGYEVAIYIKDRYQKVDSITYMFWRTSREGDGVRFACRLTAHSDTRM